MNRSNRINAIMVSFTLLVLAHSFLSVPQPPLKTAHRGSSPFRLRCRWRRCAAAWNRAHVRSLHRPRSHRHLGRGDSQSRAEYPQGNSRHPDHSHDSLRLRSGDFRGRHWRVRSLRGDSERLRTAQGYGGGLCRFLDWKACHWSAITAMASVLLNLLLGPSRVVLPMGRRRDLPNWLARMDYRRKSPRRAVIVMGVLLTGLVLIGNVQTTWSFGAFAVLIYYALTNFSALRLPRGQRRFPRIIPRFLDC